MKAEIRTGRTRSAVSAPFPDAEPSSSHQALAPLTLSRVLAFSLPALGAVLADPLMSLVDTACVGQVSACLLYTSPSPRDKRQSRMPSSA